MTQHNVPALKPTTDPTLRWRQVPELDESWQLVRTDPTFKAAKECELDGFRPVACLWRWAWGSESSRPWRACLETTVSNRTYTTRQSAMRWVEKWVAWAQKTNLTGSQSMKSITLNFAIPANVDSTSETQVRMGTLLLEALDAFVENDNYIFTDDERALASALLTES